MIIDLSGKIKSGKDTVANIAQLLLLKSKGLLHPSHNDIASALGVIELSRDYINDNCGYDIKKFADELKDTICRWINCTREQLEDHIFKDTPLHEMWWKWKVTDNDPDFLESYYYTSEEEAQYAISSEGELSLAYEPKIELIKTTPRILMQLLGTEAGRNILHPNLWINILFSKYKPDSNWIITDNRFLNELQAVKKHQSISIRVERDLKLRHGYETMTELKIQNHELWKVVTHPGETELDDCKLFDYTIYNNGSLEELIEQVKFILEKENII